MKAAYIQQTGPPENILFGELPAPKPGPTQCLIKVVAVAVNPVDTYIRSGLVQMPLPLPFISMVMPLQFPLHPEVAVPASPIVLPVIVPLSVAPLLNVPVERTMAVPLAGVPNAEP